MTLDRNDVAERLFSLIDQAYNGGLVKRHQIFTFATTAALQRDPVQVYIPFSGVIVFTPIPQTWNELRLAPVEILQHIVSGLHLEERLGEAQVTQ